jgi:hypothetical protein
MQRPSRFYASREFGLATCYHLLIVRAVPQYGSDGAFSLSRPMSSAGYQP